MGIETFNYIDSLNTANPTSTDNVSEGDNHIRGIKTTLKNSLPNINGAVTATDEELNILDGVTATTAQLNYLNTTTSNVQSQLDAKLTNLSEDTTPQLGGDLDTNGNDVNFGDNVKAKFGASDDLQIYHDGSHSYIGEVGTGNLRILAENFSVRNPANNENMLSATPNAGVYLNYNNSLKLATTSTGIDVTGDISCDSNINIEASSGYAKIEIGGPSGAYIDLKSPFSDDYDGRLQFNGTDLLLQINPTVATAGGAVKLYHGAFSKLATTSTGIDVTGTVTADGLTVSTGSSGASAHSLADELMVEGSGNSGITIASGTTSSGRIAFADSGDNLIGRIVYDHGDNSMQFGTGGAGERMRITSSGNVGIGTTSSVTNSLLNVNGGINSTSGIIGHATNDSFTLNGKTQPHYGFNFNTTGGSPTGVSGYYGLAFATDGTERMRIDSSGNLLVGTTDNNVTNNSGNNPGINIGTAGIKGMISAARYQGNPLVLNRLSNDGDIISFAKDGTTVGIIGTNTSNADLYIGTPDGSDAVLGFRSNLIFPSDTSGGNRDNIIDLGGSSQRWDDIYATNGTIQTSDRNEKQDIEELSEAEQRVAIACKGLMRKYRWKAAVAEKGADARIHFGIIAQDLQDAFTAEGLDAGRYAMFTSSTWYEKEVFVDAVEAVEGVDATYDEDGNELTPAIEDIEGKEAHSYLISQDEPTEGYTERTRLGVRYPELLAFIISAL